jgi:SAM-dependent methyltransferase
MPRPVERYRQDFLALLLAQRPESVLDVGCGDGALLRDLAARGIPCAGVDVDARAVSALVAAGLSARGGDAAQLPYANGSFDWVVMQYSAHHLASPEVAVAEMWRVARSGLLLLDPWYDTSITSQRVSLAIDRWSKRIDRQRGMVHNEVLSAAELLAPLAAEPQARCRIVHWLDLAPLPLAAVRERVATQLESVPPSESLRREAAALVEHAERDGASDDGAILVFARRCGED